jgi:hypothetical protein
LKKHDNGELILKSKDTMGILKQKHDVKTIKLTILK